MRLNETAPLRRAVVGSNLPLLADALAGLMVHAGLVVDAPFTDSTRARAAALTAAPEVTIFDFVDDEPSGLDILRDLRATDLPTRVILFVGLDGLDPIDAVELGVDGLLLRDATVATVAHCIDLVVAGEQWLDPRAMRVAYDRLAQRHAPSTMLLTPRERDVARLVATGQRNRSIAVSLGISEGTVKMHLHNVYAKMGLESRTQLAMDARLAAMG